ncbi:Protein GLUTAMINE DUMPER 1 [Bienertia sinuspersici]
MTTSQPKSPWHSPVPYLFGGLAAMLGLIAFALLILACSYWKLSRDDAQQQSNIEGNDLESGDEKGDEVSKVNGVPVFEEKIVVIMAGNDKPTFLATPLMLSSKSTFHDHVMAESSSVSNDDDHHNDDDDMDKQDETTDHHLAHN